MKSELINAIKLNTEALFTNNKKTLPNIDSVPTGDERIELPLKVLETLVIPFDQSPICWPCSLHCLFSLL